MNRETDEGWTATEARLLEEYRRWEEAMGAMAYGSFLEWGRGAYYVDAVAINEILTDKTMYPPIKYVRIRGLRAAGIRMREETWKMLGTYDPEYEFMTLFHFAEGKVLALKLGASQPKTSPKARFEAGLWPDVIHSADGR